MSSQRTRLIMRQLSREGYIMKIEQSHDIWLVGLDRALQQAPKDHLTPTLVQLYIYGIGVDLQHLDRATIRQEQFTDFHRRANIVHKIFTTSAGGLSRSQANGLIEGLVSLAERHNTDAIQKWRERAADADKSTKQLLASLVSEDKPNPAPVTSEDDICIVCMDDIRSVIYRPCQHRVCCTLCAEDLWKHSQACPWCRVPCEQP